MAGACAQAGQQAGDVRSAPAYEDRLIEGNLDLQIEDEAHGTGFTDPSGLPRSLVVDLRAQRQSSDSSASSSSSWVLLRGTAETANYGFITIDAAARLAADEAPSGLLPRSRSPVLTVDQRRMPFGGGWLADNAAGLVQTRGADLAARQARYGVASRLVLGAASSWSHQASGATFSLSTGEPVSLDAVGQSGYTALGGRASVASFGLEHRATGWSYAAQAFRYEASPAAPAAPQQEGAAASGGLLQSLRLAAPWGHVQGNLLRTGGGGAAAATGAWLDAEVNDGPVEHRFGLNRLPRPQEWLGVQAASGSSGGYYRWRWRSRQLVAEAQVDHQSVKAPTAAGDGFTITQAYAGARYLFDQATAWGLQLQASESAGSTAGSVLAYRERFGQAGSWRAFAALRGLSGRAPESQAGISGGTDWASLRTSVSAAVSHDEGGIGRDLAVTAQADLSSRADFILGARSVRAAGQRAFTLDATLQYRLSAEWVLSALVNRARGSSSIAPAGPVGGPPGPPSTTTPAAPRAQYAFLSLRYETSAGSPTAPLGGARGAGGGRVSGVLFLDADGNGALDPGEERVAGATVVLSGRYAVRTDDRGRYEFAFVAAGRHTLAVVPDGLPLPWGFGNAPVREIEIERRDALVLDLGALRQ